MSEEDCSLSLDEYSRKMVKVHDGLNMSLDEICLISYNKRKREEEMNLQEPETKRKCEEGGDSLADVIRMRDIKAPEKKPKAKTKMSKWDRYKCDDSDEEEDDSFIPAHISSDEEEEEEEEEEVDEVEDVEPIHIPMHAGHDDDDHLNNKLELINHQRDQFYEDTEDCVTSFEDEQGNSPVYRRTEPPVYRRTERCSSTFDVDDEDFKDPDPIPLARKNDLAILPRVNSALSGSNSTPPIRFSAISETDEHFVALFSTGKPTTDSLFIDENRPKRQAVRKSMPAFGNNYRNNVAKNTVKRAAAYDEDLTPDNYKKPETYALGDGRWKAKSTPALDVSIGPPPVRSGLSLEDMSTWKKKARSYFSSGCPDDLVEAQLEKYWKKRYSLFSKFDDGIKLDHESWYSVTPESVAESIASRCYVPDGVIVDGFCGCGGNTIQFAKKNKVIAIDVDPQKIAYAKHNARIYGVERNIEFRCGDFLEIAPTLKADAVFLSPPWGGPTYLQSGVFDMRTMIPMDGYKVFEMAKKISDNIAYFVPRTTNQDQLLGLGFGSPVEIENNHVEGRTIACTAYYGNLVKKGASYLI